MRADFFNARVHARKVLARLPRAHARTPVSYPSEGNTALDPAAFAEITATNISQWFDQPFFARVVLWPHLQTLILSH